MQKKKLSNVIIYILKTILSYFELKLTQNDLTNRANLGVKY